MANVQTSGKARVLELKHQLIDLEKRVLSESDPTAQSSLQQEIRALRMLLGEAKEKLLKSA